MQGNSLTLLQLVERMRGNPLPAIPPASAPNPSGGNVIPQTDVTPIHRNTTNVDPLSIGNHSGAQVSIGNHSGAQVSIGSHSGAQVSIGSHSGARGHTNSRPDEEPFSGVAGENVLFIDDTKKFFETTSKTEVIRMKTGVCNDEDICEWNLRKCRALRELYVGDHCLEFVKELTLVGLECLEKVEIGADCCTESKDKEMEASGRSTTKCGKMEVSDCPRLKRLAIGRESCVNWTSFVVKNCTAIQEVSIGDGCFVHCENTVFEGAYRRME